MTKEKRRDIALAFIASLSAEHIGCANSCRACLARERLDDVSTMKVLREYVKDCRDIEKRK